MEGIVSKIKKQNRRAFTLTELLIVVIVIGVLSAV
ncbi:prepilin-type N-terminal cleavage/methylation domain-containing protein, partial [Candidatus Avelusimicrobium aviculae]